MKHEFVMSADRMTIYSPKRGKSIKIQQLAYQAFWKLVGENGEVLGEYSRLEDAQTELLRISRTLGKKILWLTGDTSMIEDDLPFR